MPSREAFRAKYAFLEETVETTTTTTTSTSTNNTAFNQSHKSVVMPSPVAAALPPKPQSLPRPIPPPLSSDGSSSSSSSHHPGGARRRMEDRMYELESTVQRLQDEIYILNNGKAFNLASYKQISQVLFGIPDQSTSKAVLEGMAASNVMAKLLLEYRQAKLQLSKLQKKKAIPFEQKVTSVTRPKPRPKNHTKQEEDGGDDGDGNTTTTLPHEQLQDPLLLVDTSSFVYRAYFSMPPMHRNSDGMPVGAVLGFCNMLNRLVLNPMLRGEQPRLVLCCDASGPTYRHDLFKDYKGHRAEAPMDLIPQFPLIQQAAKAYGMIQIQSKGYEADDVIATLASCAVEEQVHVDILSGDKDLMQLVTDTTTTTTTTSVSGANNVAFAGAAVEMIDPMTMTKVTHETVVEKWGVPSHQLGDVLALAGDAADNIPGVPGIGPKIAAQLLQEYGTLEHLLENADQIKQKKRRENLIQFADQARLSQELVRLESNIPWEGLEIVDPLHECGSETKVAGLRMERMNADRILKFYDEMGFVTIKQRLLERLEMQDRVNYNKELNNASAMKKKPYSGPKKVKGLPDPEEYKDVPF